MAMIKCPNCDEKISETSPKCIYCGHVLQVSEVEVAVAQAKQAEHGRAKSTTADVARAMAMKQKSFGQSASTQLLKKLKEEAKGEGNKRYDKFMAKHGSKPSKGNGFLGAFGIILALLAMLYGIALGKRLGKLETDYKSIFELCGDKAYLAWIYIALAVLSSVCVWYSLYKSMAYRQCRVLSNYALIHSIKKNKIDLTEDVRNCLKKWNAADQELVTTWIYVEKPITWIITRISFIICVFVLPLLLGIGPILLCAGLSYTTFAPQKGVVMMVVGGVSLVLFLVIAFNTGIFERITDISIFNKLRHAFPEEYPNSNATYVYGFTKPTRTVAVTKMEQVPTGETVNGVPVMKSVTVKTYEEAEIPGIKRKICTLLWCIFLGEFGAHYFYEGNKKEGFNTLITLNLFGFGWILDVIDIIFFKPMYYIPKKKEEQY